MDSTSSELIVENVVTWYIPNSFTPNNDGTNDEFGPVGYSIEGYELSVFGRWGQAVFVSSGSFDKWNGNDESGKPYPEGVYVYKLKIVNDPARKVRTGTVTIIR
ncbi:MAG: gliding motility-associated C-terminal domain-containing protein [Bacteroidetes bacterium]|nr:gliding motility-associated C-terminal domain-containing protein [Bacteroidota bacterium]